MNREMCFGHVASHAWKLVSGSVLLGTLAALPGCGSKAEQADCEKMVEHDYGILDKRSQMSGTPAGEKLLDSLKKKSLEACVGKYTKSQVECHLKAETPADMDKCDPK